MIKERKVEGNGTEVEAEGKGKGGKRMGYEGNGRQLRDCEI
jgi:hypothetical protein